MDQLNPLDLTFLDVENPEAPLVIAVVAVLEGPPPELTELKAFFAPRIAEIPRFRQRLQSMPYDVVRPIWVDAGELDIDGHIRGHTLPAPGSHAELEDAVAQLATVPLDRTRPLWDGWLVDGLADGAWALVFRVHHAAIDGVGGATMMLRLFDLDADSPGEAADAADAADAAEPGDADQPGDGAGRDGPDAAEPAEAADEAAGPGRAEEQATHSWGDAVDGGPSDEIRAIAAAIDQQARQFATRLGGLVEAAARGTLTRRAGDALKGLATALTSATTPSAEGMLGPVGPRRRWVTAKVPLADLRPIRRQYGGTVNDVALTALTGALRQMLTERGVMLTGRNVKVFVPVNTRSQGDDAAENQISGMVAELPVGAVDPVERLRAVILQLRRLKISGESFAFSSLLAAAAWAPTPVARVVVRLGAPHILGLIDTIATNVPGPPFPMYVAGRRVLEMYPYVPIREPLRMVVAMFSYDGALYLGVTGDAEAMPDLRAVSEGFVRSVAELADRALRRPEPVGAEGPTGPSPAPVAPTEPVAAAEPIASTGPPTEPVAAPPTEPSAADEASP